MIIVDGPDGAGKSTLCKQLYDGNWVTKILPSPRLIIKRRTDMLYSESKRYLRVWGNNRKVVVDRFLFSEMVYGPILRNTCIFSTQEYLDLLTNVIETECPIIFCLPDELNFKPEESSYVKENMGKIVARYQEIYEETVKLYKSVISFNWQNQFSREQLKVLLEKYQA